MSGESVTDSDVAVRLSESSAVVHGAGCPKPKGEDSIILVDWSAHSVCLGFPFQRTSTERCVEVAFPRAAHTHNTHESHEKISGWALLSSSQQSFHLMVRQIIPFIKNETKQSFQMMGLGIKDKRVRLKETRTD